MSEKMNQVQELLRQGKKQEAAALLNNLSSKETSDSLKQVQKDVINSLEDENDELRRQFSNNSSLHTSQLVDQNETFTKITNFLNILTVQVANDKILALVGKEIQQMMKQPNYRCNLEKLLMEIDNIKYQELQERNIVEIENKLKQVETISELQKTAIKQKDQDIAEMTNIMQELQNQVEQFKDGDNYIKQMEQNQIIKELNQALLRKQQEVQQLLQQIKKGGTQKSNQQTDYSDNDDIESLRQKLQEMQQNFQQECDAQVDAAYEEMQHYFEQFIELFGSEIPIIQQELQQQKEIVQELRKTTDLKLNQFSQLFKQYVNLVKQQPSQQDKPEQNNSIIQQLQLKHDAQLNELRYADHQFIEELKQTSSQEINQLKQKIKQLETQISESTEHFDQKQSKPQGDCKQLFTILNQVNQLKQNVGQLKKQLINSTQQCSVQINSNIKQLQNLNLTQLCKKQNIQQESNLPNIFPPPQLLYEARFSIINQFKKNKLLTKQFINQVIQVYEVIFNYFNQNQIREAFQLEETQDILIFLRYNYNYAVDYFIKSIILDLFDEQLKFIFNKLDERNTEYYYNLCVLITLLILDGFTIRETRMQGQQVNQKVIVFPSFERIESQEVLNALVFDVKQIE